MEKISIPEEAATTYGKARSHLQILPLIKASRRLIRLNRILRTRDLIHIWQFTSSFPIADKISGFFSNLT